jgi:hypothetical protein
MKGFTAESILEFLPKTGRKKESNTFKKILKSLASDGVSRNNILSEIKNIRQDKQLSEHW